MNTDRVSPVLRWLAGAGVLAATLTSAADMVTLADGSRLVGVVERLADGKIVLHTEFAGTLEIDSTKIKTIDTDEPVHVRMNSGDEFVGPVQWAPEAPAGQVQTQHGQMNVQIDEITALWDKDGKSPEVLAMEAQLEAARPKWSFTAEAGLTYQQGNTEQFVARGRVQLDRKTDQDLFTVYLLGEYAEQNKTQTAGEVRGGSIYEYNITERVFWYLRGELEYDEFENLELRAQALTGLGYYFIKKEHHELKGRAGIGIIHETFFDGFDRTDFQAEVGLDYRIDLGEWGQFVSSNTWYPTFESLRDYRLVSDNAYLIPLKLDNWKLKLGALFEYDPIPRPGFQRLDQTYYANILVEVK